MLCFHCGNEVEEHTESCPYCGANLHLYRTILLTADAYYNEGLERAKVRDLSGAIESLRECLSLNKYQIQARNLLGLVYFEMGDMVQALSEWVISKNFSPDNNPVDVYLNELQNTPGMLDKLNTTIKKYNQAIEYCRQGSRDLARIQLRRVLSANKKLVKGHQLLALLCIQDGEYEEARKALNEASKIDVKNTTTLRYMQEVKDALKEQNQNSKKKRRKDDTVTFQDGNDMIRMPNGSVADLVDNTKGGILNVLLGVLLGLLITFFLVVPTVRQNAKNEAANNLVDATEEVATSSGSIQSLKDQVTSLEEELAKYQDTDNIETSYEHIITAYNLYNSGDLDGAYQELTTVSTDSLGNTGTYIYTVIVTEYKTKAAEAAAAEGYSAYNSKDYDTAITKLSEAVDLLPTYEDGKALYYLAESYSGKWQFDDAKTCYEQYITLFPEGYFASKCQESITAIEEASDDENAATDNTRANTTNQDGDE